MSKQSSYNHLKSISNISNYHNFIWNNTKIWRSYMKLNLHWLLKTALIIMTAYCWFKLASTYIRAYVRLYRPCTRTLRPNTYVYLCKESGSTLVKSLRHSQTIDLDMIWIQYENIIWLTVPTSIGHWYL